MVVRLQAAAGAAVMAMLALGASGAQAASPFQCHASALRVSVGGQQSVEPVTAGPPGDCTTVQATPPVLVPSLLTARALIADTAYDAARVAGSAEGGVAGASVLPTPEQIAQLPTEQAISNLPDQTLPAPAPLAAVLTAAGLPTTLTLDLRDAVRALVPTPGAALVSADILNAKATIGCAAGGADLKGLSQVAGVKIAGQDIGVNGAVSQAVSLIDSQSISPSQLDVSKISIPGVPPGMLAQVQAGIAPALAALPPISLPASVVQVKLTPNEQIRTANSLTQRALHAEVSLAGQPLLDAVLGEAFVSGSSGACAAAAQGGVADQVLSCTDRKLVLVDVLPRGSRVKLLGYANRDYVGRRVAIRLRATGHVVAHALVRPDGSFTTTAAAPPMAMLATNARANRVRYRAEIGRELSLPLKLQRRMTVSSLTAKGGMVTIKGRVVRPLTTPRSEVRVVRRVSCHKVVLVKRFTPRPDGTFSVAVKAPSGTAAAVYRLTTYVREKPSNPRRYPTFTLPRGVALNTR
jgi:hypothetical protein